MQRRVTGDGRLFGAVLAVAMLLLPIEAPAAQADLEDRLGKALSDPRLDGATIALRVQALRSGRIIYTHNAMRALLPASNQKLITAATALRELGPDYEFRTRLLARGGPDAEGVLEGDLVLRGSGDPTVGVPGDGAGGGEAKRGAQGSGTGAGPDDQFRGWAALLARKAFRRVTGDLVVDDTAFDRSHVHPDWPRKQLWKPYAAPVGALSYGGNCITVGVRPGAEPGDPARLSWRPQVPLLEVRNRCVTDPGRRLIWFYRAAGSRVVTVGGRVRVGTEGYTGRVSVPEPGLFAGQVLASRLEEVGISLEGRVRLALPGEFTGRDTSGPGWEVLAERRTPLPGVLEAMLRESNNTYAEHVLKAVGADSGRRGTWVEGLRPAARMLHELGFRPGRMALADGSGLSRKNRLCAALICELLLEMDRSEHGGLFRRLLAAPGQGTLEGRLGQEPYADVVRAKTGYLLGVGALSGYARARSGTEVAFSILINDFRGGGNAAMKQIEDRVVQLIVDHAR